MLLRHTPNLPSIYLSFLNTTSNGLKVKGRVLGLGFEITHHTTFRGGVERVL